MSAYGSVRLAGRPRAPARAGVGLIAACLISAALAGCGGSSASPTPSAAPGPTSPPGFGATGPMAAARMSHTATLLPNGRVLVAGGYSGGGPDHLTYLATAELYDPASGTFSATGSMTTARAAATAILLPNGRVLIAGGYTVDGSGATIPLASAELYDPAGGTFTATGSMTAARYDPCATRLPDGRVLIDGGLVVGGDGMKVSLASAEIFDPATGAFTSTGSMAAARSAHGAVLLSSGRVLVVGGLAVHSGADLYATMAELYDPAGGAFSAAGSTTGRVGATVTLLADGRVLIAGGGNATGVLASAELYQP